MLIEVHADPAGSAPTDFASAIAKAGLDGAVITVADLDRWADFADAFDDAGLVPFLGIEVPLERGALVFIPADVDDEALDAIDWTAPEGGHTSSTVKALVEDVAGTLFTSHPYDRTDADVLGDRIYGIKGVGAVVTRTGRGKLTWDALADAFAEKRGLARLGSGGRQLGSAATIVPAGIETQDALVSAIESGLTMPVEFDDPADPKDRQPPAPRPRRDDRRDGPRGRGRDRGDRGGRGGRDRGDRGGRGRGRDDRRGGGRRERGER